jgi:hypothetical protein
MLRRGRRSPPGVVLPAKRTTALAQSTSTDRVRVAFRRNRATPRRPPRGQTAKSGSDSGTNVLACRRLYSYLQAASTCYCPPTPDS